MNMAKKHNCETKHHLKHTHAHTTFLFMLHVKWTCCCVDVFNRIVDRALNMVYADHLHHIYMKRCCLWLAHTNSISIWWFLSLRFLLTQRNVENNINERNKKE